MKLTTTTLDDCLEGIIQHRTHEAYAVLGQGMYLLRARDIYVIPPSEKKQAKSCPTVGYDLEAKNPGFEQWLLENVTGKETGLKMSRSTAYNYMQAALNMGLTGNSKESDLEALKAARAKCRACLFQFMPPTDDGGTVVEHTPPPSVLSPDEVDPRLRSLLWLTQELVKMGSKPEKAIIAAGKSLPRPPAVPGSRWAAIAPAPADGLAEAAAALLDAVASKFPEGWTGNITSLAAFAPPSRHTLQRILPFVAKQAPDRVQKICRRINRRTCRQWSFITPATNSKEAVAS